MDPLPIYIVAPEGPGRDRLLEALGEADAVPLQPGAAIPGEGEPGGMVLLGPGLAEADLLGAVRELSEREGLWVPLHVDGGEPPRVRPLSLGYPVELDRVAAAARDPEGEGPLLELRWVLRFVARVRHDLNNPLTSGLAETQLLLMDEPHEELRTSLEAIQQQFRRLRDMVQELTRLRVPRPPPRE